MFIPFLTILQAECDHLVQEVGRLTQERQSVLEQISKARLGWERDQKVGERLVVCVCVCARVVGGWLACVRKVIAHLSSLVAARLATLSLASMPIIVPGSLTCHAQVAKQQAWFSYSSSRKLAQSYFDTAQLAKRHD